MHRPRPAPRTTACLSTPAAWRTAATARRRRRLKRTSSRRRRTGRCSAAPAAPAAAPKAAPPCPVRTRPLADDLFRWAACLTATALGGYRPGGAHLRDGLQGGRRRAGCLLRGRPVVHGPVRLRRRLHPQRLQRPRRRNHRQPLDQRRLCTLPQYRCRLGCILVIWVAFFSRRQRYCC